jgi:hypothetical protein
MHTVFWCGSMKEREHMEDPGFNNRIKLSCIIQMSFGRRGMDWCGSE